MALTTAEQLRFFIADRPRYAMETYYGDGTAKTFQVSGAPWVSGSTNLGGRAPSALVPVGNSWSGTGVTFDYNQGLVTFSSVVSANSAFQVAYTYGTFSDAEIDFVTANCGDMYGMRLALIDHLMGDAWKRMRWASLGGAHFDDSMAMANLIRMRDAIDRDRTQSQGGEFIIDAWSRSQEDY